MTPTDGTAAPGLREPSLKEPSLIAPGLIDPAPGAGLAAVATAVNARLDTLMAGYRAHLESVDPHLAPMADVAQTIVDAGGKRIRPAFVWWGYRATGVEPNAAVITVAAAVELLHTFALIHDDIMDRAATRRGATTSHLAMSALHADQGWVGDREWFGISSAIITGDLVSVWADQAFAQATLPTETLQAGFGVYNTMRAEVMAGQWLDVRLAALPQATTAESEHVALLKSGRYSITRPLELGATLSGDPAPELLEALRTYGDHIGVAFQMRDDVLGIFGNKAKTGKSTGGDIREGKRTVLMLTALERANATQRAVLDRCLGNPEVQAADLDAVREIVHATGATDVVEAQIQHHLETALGALDHLNDPARRVLRELAEQAVHRTA